MHRNVKNANILYKYLSIDDLMSGKLKKKKYINNISWARRDYNICWALNNNIINNNNKSHNRITQPHLLKYTTDIYVVSLLLNAKRLECVNTLTLYYDKWFLGSRPADIGIIILLGIMCVN